MSAAVVHQPRTILPKFNFVLAGTAVVLSIIAITDNVGSKTATVTKPAAAVATHKPGAGTARPEHAVTVAAAAAKAPAVASRIVDESRLTQEIGAKVTAASAKAPTVTGRILDESRLAHEVGAKITSQPSIGRLLNDVGPASQTPSIGRLLDDVGPVQAFAAAGTCGFKVGTTC